jgi:hypothetical protein
MDYAILFDFLLRGFRKKEQGIILKSMQSQSYKNYQQQIGMFIPRIIKWKQ